MARPTGCRRRAGRRGCLTARRDPLAPARLAQPGRGHRPWPSVAPGSRPAGGQSPRPAPAPPSADACLSVSRTCRSTGHRPAREKAPSPPHWQGPSPLPQRPAGIRTSRGPKAPGQRPPRHRRALRPRRVGRWPLCLPDLPVYRVPSRAGGETRCVSCSRLEGQQNPHRCNGRGHRPCHSAAPGSGPTGGPKPPASARPAHGGRFAPAGSGAGLCVPWNYRSTGHRRARARETRVAFPIPARRGESVITASLAGAIVPATAPHRDQDQSGTQSPRPAPGPPMAGAGLLLRLRERLLRVRDHAAGREVQRVS